MRVTAPGGTRNEKGACGVAVAPFLCQPAEEVLAIAELT
jgi:hypothetical protein